MIGVYPDSFTSSFEKRSNLKDFAEEVKPKYQKVKENEESNFVCGNNNAILELDENIKKYFDN